MEGAFTCGTYSHVEGTFTCESYSHVVGIFTCGSYSRVVGTFTCGSYSRVEGALMCWGFLTCGTSHQSEIRHSLIFVVFVVEDRQGYFSLATVVDVRSMSI